MASNNLQEDLAFERDIEGFSDTEKFLARQIRIIQKQCASHPCGAFTFTRKQIIAGVGGSAGISGVIITIVELIKSFVH